MKIGDRAIGEGERPYVIAEIGVNHDGCLETAIDLIERCARAGADGVKFQLFDARRLISGAARLAAYQKDAGESDPFEMLERLTFSRDELGPCVECAHAHGIHAIVSVFSVELVEEAESLAFDAYKSASPDIVHRPLLETLASTDKPLIVSTGASTPEEVERARAWLDAWRDNVAFLHCVSSYPTPPGDAHVAACADLARLVEPCVVGYSDHTTMLETGFAAVRCGARILEKHVTHDKSAIGPDHAASLTPDELERYIWWANLVGREAHDAYFDGALLGEETKRVHAIERDVREASRQSVTSVRTINAGEAVVREDLTFKRPGLGIEAWRIDEVIGRVAQRDIEADTPVMEEDLA